MEFSLTVKSLTSNANNQILFTDKQLQESTKRLLELEGDTFDLRLEGNNCFLKCQDEWLPITNISKIYLTDYLIQPNFYLNIEPNVQNTALPLSGDNQYPEIENKTTSLVTTEFVSWQTETLLEIGFSSHVLKNFQ